MSEKNPFEIVDGQVILHNEFQGIDEVILNYEQVAAIKLLIQKYGDKGIDDLAVIRQNNGIDDNPLTSILDRSYLT